MQDSLLKTYQYVNRIERPDAFRTWLFTTVRNACLMKRRRHVGEPPKMLSLDEPGASGGAAPIEVADAARPADQRLLDEWLDQRLRKALASLPSGYRVIVVLREIEGLSTREVATVTGISEANVKVRLHRARMMLRKRLEDV